MRFHGERFFQIYDAPAEDVGEGTVRHTAAGAPCGACRELMVQLMPGGYREIEVMMDLETEEIVTLGELTPKWWI